MPEYRQDVDYQGEHNDHAALHARRGHDPLARERIADAEREYYSSERTMRWRALRRRVMEQAGGYEFVRRIESVGRRHAEA